MTHKTTFIRRIELDRPDLNGREVREVRVGVWILALVVMIAVGLMASVASHGDSLTSDVPDMPWVEKREQIERCLNVGEIVERKPIPVGVTHPEKVVLDCGGWQMKAVFKILPNRYANGWWESYLSEVAAYRLDRMIELNMVPPTVTRKIGLRLGSMQYWVEGFEVFSDDPDPDRIPSKVWARIKMFDALVNNPDRNQGNILLAPDGRVALIDHSRAAVFKGGYLVRKKKRPTKCDTEMRRRIQELEEEQLHEELAVLAQRGNLKPFLKRLDKLIEELAMVPVI